MSIRLPYILHETHIKYVFIIGLWEHDMMEGAIDVD